MNIQAAVAAEYIEPKNIRNVSHSARSRFFVIGHPAAMQHFIPRVFICISFQLFIHAGKSEKRY